MYLVGLPALLHIFINLKGTENMYKITVTLFAFILSVVSLFAERYDGDIKSESVNFFSQEIDVKYNINMVVDFKPCIKVKCIENYKEKLEKTDYQTLLDNLEAHRKSLNLNDWLFYELMYATVADIFDSKDENIQTLTVSFLMAKSGYDVRMSTVGLKHLFLFIKSNDMVFGVPIIRPGRKTFINVTTFKSKVSMGGAWMNDTELLWNEGGKGMDIKLNELPTFTGNNINQRISFKYNGQDYHIESKVNHSIKEMMADYPRLKEISYIEAPLSEYSKKILLPQLRAHITRFNQKESLEFLAAFTRSFEYKWDHTFSDINLPMIADEVLISEFSDHEDRVALYYQLVKELLDLPMLVLSFMDDTKSTIAVATDEPLGKPIDYAGQAYYICDPTGPNNSAEIGKFPTAFSTSDVEVLGTYKE